MISEVSKTSVCVEGVDVLTETVFVHQTELESMCEDLSSSSSSSSSDAAEAEAEADLSSSSLRRAAHWPEQRLAHCTLHTAECTTLLNNNNNKCLNDQILNQEINVKNDSDMIKYNSV